MTEYPIDQGAGRDVFGDVHEEFRRFVCWYPSRVADVMNTEALSTPAEIFLATHSPMPLYRRDLSSVGGETALSPYSENQLLHDFLAPEDFSFVAILGGAGTGKSHLVRWLSTRLEESNGRRVLLIPRAGTSLHEILRLILKDVRGERFDEYRKRLSSSNTAMSAEEARVRLLENLAIAVEGAESVDAALTEQQDYLSAELPHMLRDPVFRHHFLEPGGVLDRLASHVVGGGGIERVEQRRSFTVADLPLSFAKVMQASKPAQSIYRDLVANKGLREAAVGWLNRYLDDSVSQLMRMSGTDLLRLMVEVRAQLAIEGVELIILIEDLATLQGIDQQLLEALIIRPRQSDMPELCRLRTVVAMTSGYYQGLKDTIHQRFDFRVIMGESETRGELSSTEVSHFTARYLNAARLAASALAGWHTGQSGSESSGDEPVPNACEVCKFRSECHAAFGESEGMGLYPFSPNAISHVSKRVSPNGFNPRTQLKEGYKPILENHAVALHEGYFPPPELLTRLGDSRLSTVTDAEIKQKDPANRARRAVLLDLWSSETRIHNLDPMIHRAFDLPELDLGSPPPPPPSPTTPDGGPVIENLPDRKLQAQLIEIDTWRAGGTMSQSLANSLREVVYQAVVSHVDWNALHLIPGNFVGAGNGFRQANSIVFLRQVLQGGRGAIQLQIPQLNEDPTDAALALQGLLHFKHHGSWQFANAMTFYRAFARQVDMWGKQIVAQVNRLTESQKEWDPVPAGVELLAIGARIFGRPRSRDPERQDLVDALFADLPERDDEGRSEGWQKLERLVRKHHDKTREIVLSRIACSKGDSRKLQMIDVSHVLPALSGIRRTGRPSEVIPPDLPKSMRFLIDYRQSADEWVESAVNEERSYQLDQFQFIAEQLGSSVSDIATIGDKRQEAIGALRQALNAAVDAGVLAGPSKATLDEKLIQFEGVQIQAWAESISRIHNEEDSARLMTNISLIPTNAARVAKETLELADRFLTRTNAVVLQGGSGGDENSARELNEVQESINGDLTSMIDTLGVFGPAELKP
jgi:hypothetical protein